MEISTEDVRILEGSGEAIFDESGTFTSSEGLRLSQTSPETTLELSNQHVPISQMEHGPVRVIDAVYTNFTETLELVTKT